MIRPHGYAITCTLKQWHLYILFKIEMQIINTEFIVIIPSVPTVVCPLMGSRPGNWENKDETEHLEEGPNTLSGGNSPYEGHCCHVIYHSLCTYVPSTHPTKSVTGDPLCEVDAAYLSSLWWRIQWNARKLLERKRAKLCKVLSKGGEIYDIVYQCLSVVQVWSNPVILFPHFSKMKMFMPKYTY